MEDFESQEEKDMESAREMYKEMFLLPDPEEQIAPPEEEIEEEP